ncbi:hypothetical protein BKA70DRAFT_105113 [Coprinopsis sp. MPI-PUGE-AT-0042]|nr:hypothetical protein BKA70DRAFT_105113 [Coprinopsis sp. MPI-PUGE-AT-0042]
MEARTAKALPAELLDRIASMLAIDLGTTGYATEQSEASKALCNLALTSRSLRDISQPYLFSMLSICVADMPDDDSWTVQNANEAIAIFETNPRLLDYIRHFVLLFRTSCHLVDPDYIRGDVETCQKLLGFFLPKLQKLKYLRTESRDVFRAGELAGWGIWGEATRTAFSSCIARNPLETLVVRSWAGRLCFLDHVPPSVVTLRIGDLCTPYFRKSTGLVDDSPFLSLKPSVKPTTFQLEDFVAVPHFVTQDRLSRLHTLELKNQYHNTLKILLRLAPPSLQCLRLHYRIRGFRRGECLSTTAP